MKKVIVLVALVAVLVPLVAASAGAQDVKKALSEYVLVPGTPAVMSIPFAKPAGAPSYCKPCLFYTGDFNYNNGSSPANGLFNADDSPLGITAYVWDAFTVPKGKKWKITGLFINTLANASTVDPTVTWSINKGVTSGSGGTTVASGTGTQKWSTTGRSGFGLTEYNDFAKLKKAVTLKAGTYFLNVWTSCTTSSCNGDLFYESDQESQPGINQYPPGKKGEQPWDNAYFNSSSFGANWEPTWGSSGACGGVGCDQFSMGATGTAADDK